MNTTGLIPAKTDADHTAEGIAMGLSPSAASLYAEFMLGLKRTRLNEQPHYFDSFIADQQAMAREGYADNVAIDELIRWRRAGGHRRS